MENQSQFGKKAFARKYPRTNVDLKVEFSIPGGVMGSEEARTCSLGGGGMMLVTSTRLSAGTKLEMFLYYHSIVIPVDGEVVWVKEPGETGLSGYSCGLQYLKKSESDLMHIDYILKAQTEVG